MLIIPGVEDLLSSSLRAESRELMCGTSYSTFRPLGWHARAGGCMNIFDAGSREQKSSRHDPDVDKILDVRDSRAPKIRAFDVFHDEPEGNP